MASKQRNNDDVVTIWILETNQESITERLPNGSAWCELKNALNCLNHALPGAPVRFEEIGDGHVKGTHSLGSLHLLCKQVLDAEAVAYHAKMDPSEAGIEESDA